MEGTVLTSKCKIKKGGRGPIDTRVSKYKNICIVRCKDNNMVRIASTFVGNGDKDKVKRWSKKEKKYIEVDRPQASRYYNDYMGGC